jgi:uncharacterized protein YqgV (UPF0045/DUF77 family)
VWLAPAAASLDGKGGEMIGEIAVVPQTDDGTRDVVAGAVEEIAGCGLRYQVGATATCVEGELSDIFAAVEAIQARLDRSGVQRALLELRLQFEPHPETLEHQVEGIAAGHALGSGASSALGLAEQDLREQLADELVRAMRAEGGKPTVHAIAHSVARVVEEDHLRMLEQLERAGVRLEPPVGAR